MRLQQGSQEPSEEQAMGDIKDNLRRFQNFHLCYIGQKKVSFNSPIIPSSSKAQHVIEEHIHVYAHTGMPTYTTMNIRNFVVRNRKFVSRAMRQPLPHLSILGSSQSFK